MSLDIYLEGIPNEQCGYDETDFNITHNLNSMAGEAGLYELLWRNPDGDQASGLIEPISKALREMVDEPERFEQHNPGNGWGTFEGFVSFLMKLRAACKKFPNATIRRCR